MPREALSEPNVAGGPVEVGAGGVAQGVEAEGPVEAGALGRLRLGALALELGLVG